MKKILSLIALSIIVSSCAQQTSNGVSSGLIYTSWKDRAPSQGIDNSIPNTKKGEACVKSYFGLLTIGDSSVEEAKEVSQIKKVTHVDRSYEGIGSIYQKGCTIVHGN